MNRIRCSSCFHLRNIGYRIGRVFDYDIHIHAGRMNLIRSGDELLVVDA